MKFRNLLTVVVSLLCGVSLHAAAGPEPEAPVSSSRSKWLNELLGDQYPAIFTGEEHGKRTNVYMFIHRSHDGKEKWVKVTEELDLSQKELFTELINRYVNLFQGDDFFECLKNKFKGEDCKQKGIAFELFVAALDYPGETRYFMQKKAITDDEIVAYAMAKQRFLSFIRERIFDQDPVVINKSEWEEALQQLLKGLRPYIEYYAGESLQEKLVRLIREKRIGGTEDLPKLIREKIDAPEHIEKFVVSEQIDQVDQDQ